MNWLVIAVVGAAAAWFEFNYQRSRHSHKAASKEANSSGDANASPAEAANADSTPAAESARVAEPGNVPSIAPGDENDKKLNQPQPGATDVKAYSKRTRTSVGTLQERRAG